MQDTRSKGNVPLTAHALVPSNGTLMTAQINIGNRRIQILLDSGCQRSWIMTDWVAAIDSNSSSFLSATALGWHP